MTFKFGAASPDDLRAAGWAVAVHNDYRQGGKNFTFWLMTKTSPGGAMLASKGEGETDAEALDVIRTAITASDAAEGRGIEPRSC